MYAKVCRHYGSLMSSRWPTLSQTLSNRLHLLKWSFIALTLRKRCHQYRRPHQSHRAQGLVNSNCYLQWLLWSVCLLIVHKAGYWREACWPSWFFEGLSSWLEILQYLLTRTSRLQSSKLVSSVDYVCTHLINLEVFWETFGCWSLMFRLSFRT